MSDTTNAEYAALRDHHLSEMTDWIEGRRSWTNLGPHAPWTPDVIAAMDAQEVVKHAAAAAAFGALAAQVEAEESMKQYVIKGVFVQGGQVFSIPDNCQVLNAVPWREPQGLSYELIYLVPVEEEA